MADRGNTKQGHPMPDSAEAHTDELPEHLLRDKGTGDDAKAAIQPAADPVAPNGESYRIARGRA